MSDLTIDNAFIQQYNSNLYYLAQQKQSRLEQYVRKQSLTGEGDNFDRFSESDVEEDNTRGTDTPNSGGDFSRRRAKPVKWHNGKLIDDKDKVKMLTSPQSAYAQAAAWAMNRKKDDIIIAAALGNSVAVADDNTESNVPLPASQLVGKDVGGVNSNMNLAKLEQAHYLFESQDIDDSDSPVFVIDADMQRALLQETKVASRDYNTEMVLVDGKINTFMGFKFVVVNRLLGAGTSADPKKGFAFYGSGLGLSVSEDITTTMAPDPTKCFNTRIYSKMMMGATRIEEAKVVAVDCVFS